MKNDKRESFSSRFGFIIVSVACAVGLGNVWLMPFRAGEMGGGLYVLMVIAFAFLLGVPVLICEYAVGRASRQSIANHYKILSPNNKWHIHSYLGITGNYILLMFFVVIVGFTLVYLWKAITGELIGAAPEQVLAAWSSLSADAGSSVLFLFITIAAGIGVCALGLNKGMERFGKYLMIMFFVLILVVIVRSLTLPGAMGGLAFAFAPRAESIAEHGFFTILHTAMGQALFSLSVGMGSMAIFGSYMKRERRLLGESLTVATTDMLVSVLMLILIFPAAYSFGINLAVGEGLIFVTLPNVFNQMPLSYLWSLLFYAGLFFVSFSTAAAVIENIVTICMDKFGLSRKRSCLYNLIFLCIICLPSAFGRNIWSGGIFPIMSAPPIGHIGAFFTYIVMDIILPVGAIVYLVFCFSKKGWGAQNFLAEANAGSGLKFPLAIIFYCKYIVPIAISFIFIFGVITRWFL